MSTEGSDGPKGAPDTLQETPRISLRDLQRKVPNLTGSVDINLESTIAMLLAMLASKTDAEKIDAISERMAQEIAENPDFADEEFRRSVADLVVRSGMKFTEAVFKVQEERAQAQAAEFDDSSDTIAEEVSLFELAVRQVIVEKGMTPDEARAEVQRQIEEGELKLEE